MSLDLNPSAAKRFFLTLVLLLASPLAQADRYSDAEVRAVETSDEARVREIREQEVNQLRIALGRRLPQNRMADLYLRLAEIYLESYRQEFLLEGRAHEKRLERNRKDKTIDRSRSRPYLELGVKASQEILSYRIPFNRLDQVYYFLGFNLNELGRTRDAIKNFQELIRRFPSSPFVGEAHREVGEAAYNQRQYRRAIPAFEAARPRVPEAMRPRVEHRLAWCYYRTKQYGRAIETMKAAVSGTSQKGERLLSLKEEALRDMAVFMTESGRVDEAIAYFSKVSGDQDYYPKTLERLGKNYERNVEPEKAIQVFEALMKTRPESEEAFRVLVKLVDLDLRRARPQQALARITRMKWDTMPYLSDGETESQIAAQNLKAMVRRTAVELHERYRKRGDRAQLEVAENAYTVYLRTFLKPDPRNEVPEIKMYLAEVKRDLGKSREASDLYRQIVQGRDSRYSKEAGTLWTASLAEAIRKTPSRKSDTLSDLEREYVEATDRLVESLPRSQPAREARLRSTQVLAGYADSRSEAIKRIREIVSSDPSAAQSITAARLWLQILQEHPELGDAESARAELLASVELMKFDAKSGSKLRGQIQEQITRAQIASIAREEKEKDFASAAQGYEKFAADALDRESAEKALGNAVGAYLKVGDASAVDRVLTGWVKRYPRSVRAADSLRSVATYHLILGSFDESAQGFKKLSVESQDPDALETAARIWEGSGDKMRAQQSWAEHLHGFPKSQSRARVALQLALAQDAQNLDREASIAFRNCIAARGWLEAECGARLGDLFDRSKDRDGAMAAWKQAGKVGGKSLWIGYARFRLAEMREAEGKFEPLKMPESVLKKGIDTRLAFLESLTRSYESVVDAGGPWAVMALHRLSQWVARFADDLDRAEPLPTMDLAAVAQFRKNLAAVSAGLRARAVKTWNESYSKAVAAQLLTPALPEIADSLAHFGKQTRAQGSYPQLRLAGISADGGATGRKAAFERVRERLVKNAQDASAWVDYGNLLWGDGRPGIARIAYDRALAIHARHAGALSNRGVVGLMSVGADDPAAAQEAMEYWTQALKSDEFLVAAKWNKAQLLNYFRLFAAARPYWEQVKAKASGAEIEDGLGVALAGEGKFANARSHFANADELGAAKKRFVKLYQEAAMEAVERGGCTDSVRARIDDLEDLKLMGMEQGAVNRLKAECKRS